VIQIVGPNWNAGVRDRALLVSCYVEALAVADELGARSVAIPLVSAGVYGWPREDAIRAAVDTLRLTTASISTSVEEGRIVAFSRSTYDAVVSEVLEVSE